MKGMLTVECEGGQLRNEFRFRLDLTFETHGSCLAYRFGFFSQIVNSNRNCSCLVAQGMLDNCRDFYSCSPTLRYDKRHHEQVGDHGGWHEKKVLVNQRESEDY